MKSIDVIIEDVLAEVKDTINQESYNSDSKKVILTSMVGYHLIKEAINLLDSEVRDYFVNNMVKSIKEVK